jgi:hypothetical protein
MTTKEYAKLNQIVKTKLENNVQWAIRAMVRIYECNQTEEEKCMSDTYELNGIGFNGADANILSSFAQQVEQGRTMSAKQMAIIMKKMKKYSKQVIQFIPEKKQLDLLGSE